ncbi:hypothetical protein [Catelliglobosispora koreensis]|uniref:hypothetical protein n=1 Tax=Catelliglobosispora koreensis TaxID=129052 RepID=UPI0012FCC63A|nr:hypothetical protein [Catelliglobosispora koreensis]
MELDQETGQALAGLAATIVLLPLTWWATREIHYAAALPGRRRVAVIVASGIVVAGAATVVLLNSRHPSGTANTASTPGTTGASSSPSSSSPTTPSPSASPVSPSATVLATTTTQAAKPKPSPTYPSGDFFFAQLIECLWGPDGVGQNEVIVRYHIGYSGAPLTNLPNGTMFERRHRYMGIWSGPFFNSPQAFANQDDQAIVDRLADLSSEATGTALIRLDYANTFAEPNESNNTLSVTFTRPAGHNTGFYTSIPCHVG